MKKAIYLGEDMADCQDGRRRLTKNKNTILKYVVVL